MLKEKKAKKRKTKTTRTHGTFLLAHPGAFYPACPFLLCFFELIDAFDDIVYIVGP